MIPKFRAAFKNKIIGEVWLIDFIVETVTIPVYDKDGEYLGGNVWGLNQVTLMQSTGLFDKNGKEIFEYSELDGDYEVIFKDLRYSLRYIPNNDIIDLQDYWRDKNGEIEVTREYTKV